MIRITSNDAVSRIDTRSVGGAQEKGSGGGRGAEPDEQPGNHSDSPVRADLQGSCDVVYASWIRETTPLSVGCAPFAADKAPMNS